MIKHVELKRDIDGRMHWCPYITYSHCQTIKNEVLDSGRVMQADDITMCLTEIDLKWIFKQYNIRKEDFIVTEAYVSRSAHLPLWFTKTIEKRFYDKTMLKDRVNSPDATMEDVLDYLRSKAFINGIYGMTAQDPIRDEYEFDFDKAEWKHTDCHDEAHLEKMMNRQLRSTKHGAKDNFLPYQWAIWTTAYARDRLYTVMSFCKHPLYCDTDSVKGYGWDIDALKAYNEELRQKVVSQGNFDLVTPKGTRSTLGLFANDGNYDEFYALHAKCYVAKSNGKMHVTIAGVTNVGVDGTTKEEELGSIDNLMPGFRFVKCGGTRSTYIDTPHDFEYNGELIHSYGGCCIMDTTYLVNDGTDISADELVRSMEIDE